MKYLLMTLTALLMVGCQSVDSKDSGVLSSKVENATSSGINGVYYGGEGYYPGESEGYNTATNGNFYDDPQYGKGVLAGPNSPAKDRVIYFDYDSSDIDSRSAALIDAHAAYLKRHRSAKVVLEGHTDSRGSRGYNLALGERRAKSVRARFVKQGVPATQIRVISYGEENPAVTGYNERAYQRNRRVVIRYK